MDALAQWVRTRKKTRLECSCSMLALFHNFVLGFLSYNIYEREWMAYRAIAATQIQLATPYGTSVDRPEPTQPYCTKSRLCWRVNLWQRRSFPGVYEGLSSIWQIEGLSWILTTKIKKNMYLRQNILRQVLIWLYCLLNRQSGLKTQALNIV